jgi:multidrug efflux pump subunit AcrB
VNLAINAQNLILPAGAEKIGQYEYLVKLNASPTSIDKLNNLPIRSRNVAVLYVHDVAHVQDGYAPQTNIINVNVRE